MARVVRVRREKGGIGQEMGGEKWTGKGRA